MIEDCNHVVTHLPHLLIVSYKMVEPDELMSTNSLLSDQLPGDFTLMNNVSDQLLVLLPIILFEVGEDALSKHFKCELDRVFNERQRSKEKSAGNNPQKGGSLRPAVARPVPVRRVDYLSLSLYIQAPLYSSKKIW